MRRLNTFRGLPHIAIVSVILIPSLTFGSERPDFSGKFAARKAESGLVILTIVQNGKAIDITKTEAGKTATSDFPLDGSEGTYRNPVGLTGKGKAHFAGADLVFDVMTLTRTDPNGSPMRMHIAQRWHLSEDTKFLTIYLNYDYPDSVGLNRFPPFERMEVYRRIDTH